MRGTGMRFSILIAGALMAASTLLTGCDELGEWPPEVERREAAGVETIAVELTEVPRFFEATGTVEAESRSFVSARAMGTVTAIKVREGERVEKGQVLLTIDESGVRERVEAARAGLEEARRALESARENKNLAETTYERFKNLYDEKAVSGQEFDEVSARMRSAGHEYERAEKAVERAEAGVREAEVHLGYTRVTSPVTGVVTEKLSDTGSMARPGEPLMVVEDTSGFTVDLKVDERYSDALGEGTKVELTLPSLERNIAGEVAEVVPSVDPASRTFLVKVALTGDGLRSGLFTRARVPVGSREVILVPSGAIVARGQLTGVYAVDDRGVATFRLIRTGSAYDGRVEVLSGLTPGDEIVASGVENVTDGAVVAAGSR